MIMAKQQVSKLYIIILQKGEKEEEEKNREYFPQTPSNYSFIPGQTEPTREKIKILEKNRQELGFNRLFNNFSHQQFDAYLIGKKKEEKSNGEEKESKMVRHTETC